MTKIGFLTPSRDRPDDLYAYITSVQQHAQYPDNAFFYCYIDSDDPQLKKYKSVFKNHHNVILHVGFPYSISKSWNIIARMAYNDGCDILIMGNDDLRYLSPWDEALLHITRQITDNIYCCWFDDNIHGKNQCTFPIISRHWFKILGYFTPEIFLFGYNDTWIEDMAKRIKRDIYINHVKTSHDHWITKKRKRDNTTISNSWKYDFDALIFQQYEPIRDFHAQKLWQHSDKRILKMQ